MRRALPILALVIAAGLATGAAISDLRIEKDRDAKQRTLYTLRNIGSQNVRAKIAHRKVCSGTTNTGRPVVREYWLASGQRLELGKARHNATCEHRWRIVSAEYY